MFYLNKRYKEAEMFLIAKAEDLLFSLPSKDKEEVKEIEKIIIWLKGELERLEECDLILKYLDTYTAAALAYEWSYLLSIGKSISQSNDLVFASKLLLSKLEGKISREVLEPVRDWVEDTSGEINFLMQEKYPEGKISALCQLYDMVY